MYNHYRGNSGHVERVGDTPPPLPPPARPEAWERRPPGPLSGLSGELGKLLGRIAPDRLETGDLLLLAVLYLLYRESGDRDFLYAIAAYVLL